MTDISRSAFVGLPPTVIIAPSPRKIYEELWARDDYRRFSPGEGQVADFLTRAAPRAGEAVIDFGCGCGRASARLADIGLKVIALDFAANALDPGVGQKVGFCVHDLTRPVPFTADWGYCCDVMEHVAPEDVNRVLGHILAAAHTVYFQICTVPDHFGAVVGHPLHLTVKPHEWWRERLAALRANILHEEERPGESVFLASTWASVDDWMRRCVINMPVERLKENVAANLAAGYRELVPHQEQDREVVLLAGGPSLGDFEAEIRERVAGGAALVTVNGAYHWALGRGLGPGAQIMLDSRPHNKRFLDPVLPNCQYLLASQCDPAAVASVPREQLWLWHGAVSREMQSYITELKGGEDWFPVPGGSTVILRAIPLLRILGFKRLHIYGWDSCLMGGEHHAYGQPENDFHLVLPVRLGGREFSCHPWMISQAREFITMVRDFGAQFELAVYGPGLIAWILEHAAGLGGDDLKEQ